MNPEQIYNLKRKLPYLLFTYIFYECRTEEIKSSMNIDDKRLIKFLEGSDFPVQEELEAFCDHFKFRYSTLKTWNTMHLKSEE